MTHDATAHAAGALVPLCLSLFRHRSAMEHLRNIPPNDAITNACRGGAPDPNPCSVHTHINTYITHSSFDC